ncbi:hypothetical protein [Streptomonospora litoralis]|uniref:Uncharacterized protein n=1 Tax=Streptomonospora litoralis TaxID=2498135 RepID=A0A4P6Q0X6_9ACTN|nr:hypothetical protein [Streptomonospora litoralis]QBI53720.1 hypothetical protein EKD16_09660 [Streptomonospora litoralis]
MNSLVDIAVFGMAGAVTLAALVGLLLVVAGRSAVLPKSALGAVCAALLLAVPALAAGRTLGGDAGAGAGQAFLVASATMAVVYAAGAALLPLVVRRAAAGRGVAVPRGLRPTPAAAGWGVLVCAAFGAAGTGIALLLG